MQKIKYSVDLFLSKAGLKEQLSKREHLALWYKVTGKHIARHTLPLTIKKNKLFVEVTDSTWLYHLTMLKSRIIADFNNAAAENVINDIKFFNGDFRSRVSGEVKSAVFPKEHNFISEDENTILEPGEEENLNKAVLLSPESFQPQLRSFLKKSYLYQKKAAKK